jgi:hypothetical protein
MVSGNLEPVSPEAGFLVDSSSELGYSIHNITSSKTYFYILFVVVAERLSYDEETARTSAKGLLDSMYNPRDNSGGSIKRKQKKKDKRRKNDQQKETEPPSD